MVDGTGAPWFRGDVGLVGDRIAAVGALSGRPAKTTVDASGLVVAPGFIDMLGQSEFNVLVDGRAASKITQGVTTEITGEGASIAPMNEAMAKASAAQIQAAGGDWNSQQDAFVRALVPSLTNIPFASDLYGSTGLTLTGTGSTAALLDDTRSPPTRPSPPATGISAEKPD